jgi:hypothetical protein
MFLMLSDPKVLFATFMVLFIVLFMFIFGNPPLTHFAEARLTRLQLTIKRRNRREAQPRSSVESATVPAPVIATPDLETDTAEELLTNLAYSSRKLSENIYRRSGVYLLVGAIIAFSGLGFFYIQTTQIRGEPSVSAYLLALAPRFGILFFIQFVAFFFFRQYRSAMDEFRYFEAIKRNREETLALIRLAQQQKSNLTIQELLKTNSFYSRVETLSPGETTEMLESRKLHKDELELFGRMIDALTKVTRRG